MLPKKCECERPTTKNIFKSTILRHFFQSYGNVRRHRELKDKLEISEKKYNSLKGLFLK